MAVGEADSMNDENAKLQFYNSARAELIARVGFRDTALIAYVITIGGYFGFMLSQHFQKPVEQTDVAYSMLLLLPVPFICLTFTFIVLQHHLIIGSLGKYIASELRFSVPHWDDSNTLRETIVRSLRFRLVAQASLLALPLLYVIPFYLRFSGALAKHPRTAMLLVLECLIEFFCIILIFALHWRVHRQRIQFTVKMDWASNPSTESS